MGMHAGHIIRSTVAVTPDTPVKNVAHKIISTGLPGLPVLNKNREVVGVVTEFNILGALREGLDLDSITAQRIMSTEPMTADIDVSTNDLIQLLLLNNYTIIPIVKNGKFIGTVSRNTIMDAYLSPHFSYFSMKKNKGRFTCI